eukprot:g2819.t1
MAMKDEGAALSEPEQTSSPPEATFETRFEQFYLQLSEGRTGGMVACIDEMQRIVESTRQRAATIAENQPPQSAAAAAAAAAAPSPSAEVYDEMLQDCRRKAGEATLDRLRKLCQRLSRSSADGGDNGGGVDGEGGEGLMMSEEETVIVSYHAALLGKAEGAANIYGGFLRNRLKQVNDAAVKNLSSLRALYRLSLASGGGGAGMLGGGGDATDDGEGGTTAAAADPHPHITALATVLGEASKLMVRLAESSLGDGVMEPVAELLHKDSKAQAVKVLEWFQHDADLPKWQAQVSGRRGGGAGQGAVPVAGGSSAPSSGNGRVGGSGPGSNGGRAAAGTAGFGGGTDGGGGGTGSAFDARGMDFVIDEMALACQYCQRYLDFVADDLGLAEDQSSEFYVQVRLIEGAYVQLEDAYCLRSVEEAMRIAEPIEVQDGTYVSSMVEDASFLVHKSLRRSVSTRSEQAIMAVCNRVTEILDPHAPEPSFYGGLATEADHRVPVGGKGESGDGDGDDGRQQPDDFSTALAKALDEAADADLGPGGRGRGGVGGGSGGEAGFGGVEGAMVGINSVHVALSSVSAIQDALNRFLEASNPLVRLMLEEVARILRAYRELRDTRLNDVLDALSPPVSAALDNAFGSSSYALGPAQYELRSADLPGARRVLRAATHAMVGGDGRTGEGAAAAATAVAGAGGDEGVAAAAAAVADGGGCRAALLQEPFEELVRRLAGRVAAAVEKAARSKGEGSGAVGGGAGAGGGGGGFTEWGALLLRREVRTLQQGLAAMMETDSLNTEFDELNELVRLLNSERPSDALDCRPPPTSRHPGDTGGGGNAGLSDSNGGRKPYSPERIKEMTSLSPDKFASLHGRLMAILSADTSDDGVNSEVLSENFGEEYPLLVDIINSLLVDNRLQLSKGENDTMWYKLVQEEKAKKLTGLTPEQLMIYQVIEKAGNKGIWTRDIKTATSVNQNTLTKTLKSLEGRHLIKTAKSVTSKSKKLYMLYELTPAKEITGGPWYTDQEFDYEFVKHLSSYVLSYVKEQVSGISKIDLSMDEVKLIVTTLVYDGLLEEVRGAVSRFNRDAGDGPVYKMAPTAEVVNPFTEVPCGTCKVMKHCSEDGVVSPKTCVYLAEWLNLPNSDELF